MELSRSYVDWTDARIADMVAAHFTYLGELGYQPSPWEQEQLAKAVEDDSVD